MRKKNHIYLVQIQYIIGFCLAFFSSLVSAQSTLPPCPAEGYKHNCWGEVTSASGTKYSGEWRNGRPDGEGTLTTKSGSRYVGKFSDGGTTIEGVLYWATGGRHVGAFVKGRPHGNGIQYRPDGAVLVVGTWQDGVLQVRESTASGSFSGQDAKGNIDSVSNKKVESSVMKYLPSSVLNKLDPKISESNIIFMSVGSNRRTFSLSFDISLDDENIDLKHGTTEYKFRDGRSTVKFRKQNFIIQNDNDSIHLVLASSPSIGGQGGVDPQLRILRLSRTSDKIATLDQESNNGQLSANIEMRDLTRAVSSAARLREKFTRDADLHASEVVPQEEIALDDEFVIDLQHHGLTSSMRRYKKGLCQLWISADKIRSGDHIKFYALAREIKSKRCAEIIVDIAGPGGDLHAGIAIGYYIRRHGWSTTFGGWSPSVGGPRIGGNLLLGCASSCFNVFLSGVVRYSNSQPLMTHLGTDGRTNQCVTEDSTGAQLKRLYYSDMLSDYAKEIYLDAIATPCKMTNSVLDPERYGLFHGAKGFGFGVFKRH
jgi:hypothetical protein